MKIGSTQVAIDNAIKKHKNIVIFHHTRPDGDCLGSQHGLAQMIKDNFPEKNVYTVGDIIAVLNLWTIILIHGIESIDFTDSLGIMVDGSSSDRIVHGDLLLSDKFSAKLRIDHHPNGSDIEYDYLFVDVIFVAANPEQVAIYCFRCKMKTFTKANLCIHFFRHSYW